MKWKPVEPDTEFQDGETYLCKWRFGLAGIGWQDLTYDANTDTFCAKTFFLERHEVDAYYDDTKPLIIHQPEPPIT